MEYAEIDQALFTGQLDGVVATCFENERPLRGVAGLLDWRLRGVISHCLRAGAITGKAGECVYVPVNHHGRTLHILLAGGGASGEAFPAETLKALKKNLASLKLKKIGASTADLGEGAPAQIKEIQFLK